MRKREEWIDILRAFAMFLVVVGHVYGGDGLYYTISGPVKMPMFYLVSGYFLGVDKKVRDYLKGIISRLIVPLIVFSLFPLYVAKYLAAGEYANLVTYVTNFILGYTVWFIPSFIVTQILVYILYKFVKGNCKLLWALSLLMFIAGLYLKDVKVFDIFATDTAMTGTLFVSSGIALRRYQDKWKPLMEKNISLICGLAIYVGLIAISVAFYPGRSIDFHNVSYYNILICLLLIFSGCFSCIFIARKIPSNMVSRWVCIFGQHTLVTYLLHGRIYGSVKRVLAHFIPPQYFVVCVIISLITCIITTVISVLCGKFCPILIGQRKK